MSIHCRNVVHLFFVAAMAAPFTVATSVHVARKDHVDYHNAPYHLLGAQVPQ